MKKTLLAFALFLVIIFIVLSAFDTSDYKLEKKLWRVEKQLVQIANDPTVVPDKKFESIIRQYNNIRAKYPDSRLVPTIYAKIGLTYGLKKDYVRARKAYQEIINQYPDNHDLVAEALLNIGKTYEKAENTSKAVQTYSKILAEYPHTTVGLNIPIYIAEYYLSLNNKQQVAKSLKEAEGFYKNVSVQKKQTMLGFQSLRLLATTYMAQENWQEAINTLSMMLLDYPSHEFINPRSANLIIKSINTISVSKLKDYDIPINIYVQFIDGNEQHPLNDYLKDMIKALKDLKSQKLQVEAKSDG